MNFQGIAKRVASKKYVAGETLLLLKDLGVIKDQIGEVVQLKLDELTGEGVDYDTAEKAVVQQIMESFEKAYPGEKKNFVPISGMEEDPFFLIHEVLHLTIDPDHQMGKGETSKGPVEGAFDEQIINFIQHGPVEMAGVDEAIEGTFEKVTGNANTIGEYLQILEATPVENSNKARLIKDILGSIRNKYRDQLNRSLEEKQTNKYGVELTIRTIVAFDIVDEMLKKIKDYVSYMSEDRESKFKTFIRLLKNRLDKINAESI